MKRISYLAVPLVITMLSATATRAQDLGAQIQAANDHLINQGHVSMVLDFFAPQFVVHLSTGDVQGDPEFITEFVNELRTAFPDLHVEVQILVVQGNRVAWLRRNRGTQRGAYMGVPASDRVIEWHDMVVTRFEDGKIAEEWGVSDIVDRLRAP